jgi:hypothetical protein
MRPNHDATRGNRMPRHLSSTVSNPDRDAGVTAARSDITNDANPAASPSNAGGNIRRPPSVPTAPASAHDGRLFDIVERGGGAVERAQAVDRRRNGRSRQCRCTRQRSRGGNRKDQSAHFVSPLVFAPAFQFSPSLPGQAMVQAQKLGCDYRN